jgi:hypothetical protein
MRAYVTLFIYLYFAMYERRGVQRGNSGGVANAQTGFLTQGMGIWPEGQVCVLNVNSDGCELQRAEARQGHRAQLLMRWPLFWEV